MGTFSAANFLTICSRAAISCPTTRCAPLRAQLREPKATSGLPRLLLAVGAAVWYLFLVHMQTKKKKDEGVEVHMPARETTRLSFGFQQKMQRELC